MKPDDFDTLPVDDSVNDVLTPKQRRLVMSRIRGKDTKPEMLIRRGLYQRGLRYRVHKAGMPGTPDLVFRKYRTVVFVHGCFWHGHGCSLFKLPKTRRAFWTNKIDRNKVRDQNALTTLKADGWRLLVVWECAVKGKHRRELSDVLTSAEEFIRTGAKAFVEITEIKVFVNMHPECAMQIQSEVVPENRTGC